MAKVQAMARFTLKQAKDKMLELAPLINDHIVKLIFWGNEENTPGWIAEITSWLRTIHSIKINLPTRKKLTKREVLDAIEELNDVNYIHGSWNSNGAFIKKQKSNYTLVEIMVYWHLVLPCIEQWYDKISTLLIDGKPFDPVIVKSLITELLEGIKKVIPPDNYL